MRILILGISGMLGNAVFRFFSERNQHEVHGTLRSSSDLASFPERRHVQITSGIDALDPESIIRILSDLQPDVVINCIGLIKQLSAAKDPLVALPINAIFPHRLSRLCKLAEARLIHISTDCVFSGRSGNYLETDNADAEDLYGRSKQLGEVVDQSHAITLRTSIIGHELHSNHALVDWFLTSGGQVNGFTKAIFSGLPTIELARIVHGYVLSNTTLHGLYHISANPITKYNLLKLIAKTYGKEVSIQPNDELVIDRSLNSERFRTETDYQPPTWPALIQTMHEDFLQNKGQTDV